MQLLRRFHSEPARPARLLNQLTGKSKFVWSLQRQAAFNDLKFALSSEDVILQFPNLSAPFEVSTDASDTGIGCTLSQRDSSGWDQPVLFPSKVLTNNKLNWHTRDKEAFAFIFALRKFRPYLLGRKFIWYTDNKGLQWLRNTRDPRGRYARWLEETEEFDFVVHHRAGVTNSHADALSRIPKVHSVRDGQFTPQEFLEYQRADPVLGVVLHAPKTRGFNILTQDNVLRQWQNKRKFLTVEKADGLLRIRYNIGKRIVNQLVVPTALVFNVLRLKHDDAGHMGTAKTINLIRREYFWLTMVKDVRQYCESCVTCASSYPAPSHHRARLTLSSQPQAWQEIAIDIKGPFGTKPSKRGHRYVLVAIELFTRAAEILPIPDKSAKTVASAIIRDVFCKRGIPESLLTDRGCEFDNLTLGTIAHELGIDKKRISALHPQANGTVERLNRTIGDILRKATNTHGEDWDLEIPFVLINHMNQEHEATGYSPFFLSHGYIPRTPRLVVVPPLAKGQQPASRWAATLSSRLKEAHLGTQARDLQTKQRRVASSEETCSELHVGDSVMMYVPFKPGFPTKLQNLWQGPYVVVTDQVYTDRQLARVSVLTLMSRQQCTRQPLASVWQASGKCHEKI